MWSLLGQFLSNLVLGIVQRWIQRKDDMQEGANKEAAAVTAYSAETERSISKAEANAPKSDADVLKRLHDDTA